MEPLKCQFCNLAFEGTYKLIPHIFFGHKKKIFKKIGKNEPLIYTCPGGCPYTIPATHHFNPGGRMDEDFIKSLAVSLVPLEEHLNEKHTHEQKVVICEYCSLDLKDIIFWEHLELHIRGKTSPEKKNQNVESASNVQPTSSSSTDSGVAEIKASTPNNTDQNCSSNLVTGVQTHQDSVTGAASTEPDKPGSIGLSPLPEVELSLPKRLSSPDSLKDSKDINNPIVLNKPTSLIVMDSSAKHEPCTTTSTFSSPQTGDRLQSMQTSMNIGSKLLEISKSSILALEAAKQRQVPSKTSPVKTPQETKPRSPPLQHHSLSVSPQPISPKSESPPLTTVKLPGELAASTIPFSSFFQKKNETFSDYKSSLSKVSTFEPKKPMEPISMSFQSTLDIRDTKKEENWSTTTSLGPTETILSGSIKLPSPEKLIPTLQNNQIPSSTDVGADTGEILTTPRVIEKQKKITLSEYTKIRRSHASGESAKDERKALDVKPQESKSLDYPVKEKFIGNETKMSQCAESRSAEDPKPVLELPEARHSEAAENSTGAEVTTSTSALCKLQSGTLPDPKVKDSVNTENKPMELMRPPTPLDPPITPTVTPSPDIDSSRSTTPGERVSRPTTPLDRSASSSRRHSSEQKVRRVSGNYPKEKPRPVLTEELERQIIYGGALLKGKAKIKLDENDKEKESDSSSLKVKVDEERDKREKRKQEEREKLSREEKLSAVRKEIEMRFQEEELKRMRDKEAQKKRELELQEKIKIEEEKLRKEKEKIALEKRRAREEKKKAKKAKYRKKEEGSETESKDKTVEDDKPDDSQEVVLEKDIDEELVEKPKTAERERSPDQYEKLKLNFLSQRKQALENELKMLDNVGDTQETRSGGRSKTSSPVFEQKDSSVDSEKPENLEPNKTIDIDEDDDDDDLEAMMRKYNEKEDKSMAKEKDGESSLSLLMSSYGDSNNLKRGRNDSETSLPPDDSIEIIESDNEAEIIEESEKPEDDTQDVVMIEDDQSVPADTTECFAPRGFDEHGHPLDERKIRQNHQDEALIRAATHAAMDIMAPAKKNRGLKAASQLQCSLCKEEGSIGSYYSAYELLAHVFLTHRRKLLCRSRKVGGMTLACPEGCGFITDMSNEAGSIDYFSEELPKHLGMLSFHIRDCHTGEPEMDSCKLCSLPLQHQFNWSWQHLANHRDSRRFYCDTCNTFPFKTEVHKCPGTGLETYFNAESPMEPPRKKIRSESQNTHDVSKTKSLEELAREVETGTIDMKKLMKRKNLGNLQRFICDVCDKLLPSLSQWLVHVRLEHLSRGHIEDNRALRCFCCTWMPERFEKRREIIGVNNLIQHLVTEHHSEDWKDPDFDTERTKFTQIQRDMEKRLEREREEVGIQVPRLPANCKTCNLSIGLSKLWRYHILAHKFGEVYCSTCNCCILGHHYQEHSATCNKEDLNRVKVKVEKYRGDTWLDVSDGKKLKVSFEYDESEELGNITIAITNIIGSRLVRGNGVSHEEATLVLREEVENIMTQRKMKEEEKNKEDMESEDKEKLRQMFIELHNIDKENESKSYHIEANGESVEVETKSYFTQSGRCKILAAGRFGGRLVTALGDKRQSAVENLAKAVSQLETATENGDTTDDGTKQQDSRFACADCGSMFQQSRNLWLHRTQVCTVR